MSMEAVGGYLFRLRKKHGIGRERLVAGLGISTSTLRRIEAGQNTTADVLAALVDRLGGDPVTVQRLMLDSNATRLDGEQAADATFRADMTKDVADPIDIELAVIREMRDELAQHPDLVREALNYLRFRLSQLGQQKDHEPVSPLIEPRVQPR